MSENCNKCHEEKNDCSCKTTTKILRGPKGEKGDKGDKGDTGLQGVPGADGVSGGLGLKGDKGDKGDKGNAGEKGEKGDKGVPGIPGTSGLDGLKGDKGDKGDTGDKGDKGDKGDTGVSFKYIKELTTNFENVIVSISPEEYNSCVTLSEGCLGGEATPGFDFVINIWAKVSDPIPEAYFSKVKEINIDYIKVYDTGNIEIKFVGSTTNHVVRIVIVG